MFEATVWSLPLESKKEQFETLSKELLGRLNDANRMSALEFPFGYTISDEVEKKFFDKGSKLRLVTIRNMILIDNSFKKFKIFPTHDIMQTYIQTQKELLFDWKKEMEEAYLSVRSKTDADSEEFKELKKTIAEIERDINKLSMSAIKEAASSNEAKMLDEEYSSASQGGFSEFIHNTILNLFK